MQTSEQAAVLFANEAFYVAFTSNDIGAMEDLWAKDSRVSCVHPGWNVIIGRNEVMASWDAILADPGSARIECLGAAASITGDMAVVICHEINPQGYLTATNIFVLEDGMWKIMHHHAALSPPPPEQDAPDGTNIMQ